jgi:hypothetical protein
VTPELVDGPERELKRMLSRPDDAEDVARWERAGQVELDGIKDYIAGRAEDFQKKSGLHVYEKRRELIAELYLRNMCDINTAFEGFREMYRQVRLEEASLDEQLDVHVTFEEGAIDAIIAEAIHRGQEAGPLAFQIVKRLEYGLNLVKDRAGITDFSITDEAVSNMEGFVNNLIKKYYRQEYPQEEPL